MRQSTGDQTAAGPRVHVRRHGWLVVALPVPADFSVDISLPSFRLAGDADCGSAIRKEQGPRVWLGEVGQANGEPSVMSLLTWS